MGTWVDAGYEQLSQGTFGNGGQNLYVSRGGVLQRVYHFDFDGDGYADVLFATSQDMDEAPPAYVYRSPLDSSERIELPTLGAYYGALGDLNGDGYADFVVANQNNGTHSDVVAYVYYGSPDGLSERYKIELPAPNCRSVAIGDFNGDGRPDIAFGSESKLKIFYQTERGFVPAQSVTLDIEITHMAAGDIDGDGCADLYIRGDGAPRVLWGGKTGLDPQRFTVVGGDDTAAVALPSSTPGYTTFVEGWTPKIVRLGGRAHLFRDENNAVYLYPANADRTLGEPLIVDCPHAIAAAAGDLNADGREELVIAVCGKRHERSVDNAGEEEELSWVYWPRAAGFDNDSRTGLPTVSARDVLLVDLDGSGTLDIVICQGRTDILNSTESLVYRCAPDGIGVDNPIRLATHDATVALAGRTSDDPRPQLIFVNRITGRVRGDIPALAYLGGPDGFTPERRIEFPGQGAVDAICCDFNDDGFHDMLLVNCSENAFHLDPGSFLYWGGPGGFDPANRQVIPTMRAHGCAVGDFRRSGYLDVVFAGITNPELLVFRGGPDGLDLDHPQRIMMDPNLRELAHGIAPDGSSEGGEYREPRWLLAADFNNDGWLDLYVSQTYGTFTFILWGGPDGFSMERSTWLAAEGGICAQAADLDNDGWLELIIGGHCSPSKRWTYDSNITIYWGGPEGYREDRKTVLPGHTSNSLTVADFNRDGILDIFTTSYHSGRERDLDAYIYWGQPGGIYSYRHHTRLFTHSSSGCLAMDFNEDGWIDLAVANHKTYGNHQGLSEIWWNGPEGFAESRTTKLPTSGPHGIMSVDAGNIMDRGPEEYYVSAAFELPEGAAVERIGWEAEVPVKTWVKAQLRSAASREQLAMAVWCGPDGQADWFENGQSAARMPLAGQWIQYRLALGAVNGGNSPRVTEIRVDYAQA
ncbi:MAG: VCBS repeat-containing protein [Paenibacillaceae bacterium]|nr:VCBS repeat-containing protein [Paenibacillaceae bacterium]